jgi:hypothetical protein|tara:strand:+ start:2194 stop:2904 length:711 start_codon:yes stop_codon:yes gene_type:complete
MSTELTLDVVRSQLTPQNRLLVDENTVREIQRLATDPEYGEEFLDSYLTHLNVLKDHVKANHPQYVNAIKFFTLVEAGNNLSDAYIKVFPGRYEERNRKLPASERGKEHITSEASRYNKSVMVNEIRRVSCIPVQLIHRHLLHEAILETAHLMKFAKSDMVRQKAAATLIAELKPAEDAQINIKVEDNTTSVIDELRKATEALASEEHQAVMAGRPLIDISKSRIIDVTPKDEPEE